MTIPSTFFVFRCSKSFQNRESENNKVKKEQQLDRASLYILKKNLFLFQWWTQISHPTIPRFNSHHASDLSKWQIQLKLFYLPVIQLHQVFYLSV